MKTTEIQRYNAALERLRRLFDAKLGKPLLIQTFMGNLHVLRSNDIGYFKYISTRKSWEIALTDGSFLRLKANLRAKDLCTYNEEFVQIHQSYIINMHYLQVGSINSIFYFLHKAAEPFNCLEQDNLA